MSSLQKTRKNFLGQADCERLNVIIREVNKVWDVCDQPFQFLPYSSIRCEKVEEQLYKVVKALETKKNILRTKNIPKPHGLKPHEKFLLVAAIWLQDIGMCQILLDGDEEKFDTLGLKWGGFVREFHPSRSAEFIQANRADLRLTVIEAKVLRQICRGHRRKDYGILYPDESKSKRSDGSMPTSNMVNLPLVIAHLRLADSLHKPDEEHFEEHYQEDFQMHFLIHMDATTRIHWLKLRYFEDVKFDPYNFAINIVLRRPIGIEDNQMASLEKIVRNELQDELDSVKDILIKGGGFPFLNINCPEPVNSNKVDAKELEVLLNNLQLFDSSSTPSASALIDNVLNHLDMLKDVKDQNALVENLRVYIQGSLDKTIEERPCYVLLRNIRHFLDTILRPEFNDQNRSFLIKNAVRILREKRKAAIDPIPEKSFEIIRTASAVLLYGLSSTIVQCLEYMFKNTQREITCYVCEARTKTQYRFNNRLTYSDGINYVSELKKAKKRVEKERLAPTIEIKLIPDASASNLFSRKKVTMVLMGANGISPTGTVGHTLGHLAIADMAHNYHIPVYVIASALKIGMFEQKPDVARKNVWHTTDISFAKKISEEDTINWREDIVPPDKITDIITGKGRIEPTRIREHEDSDWLSDLIPDANHDEK